MRKLIEILFIVICFITIACGGFYLNTKFTKYVAGPTCNCQKFMKLDTDNQLKDSFIELKKDELHYLDQIFKYTKHLEFLYRSGKLEDKNKALYTQIILSNINSEREKVKKEIEELNE